jgi:hypothetical protein
MYQNDYFIVMISQKILHVSAYQRRNQGAHMFLTSYLYTYVGVHIFLGLTYRLEHKFQCCYTYYFTVLM